MAAPPYLTWAAEGFELLPACLILQLLQELQPGSSGSIACILQACWGTLSLPGIHRWGEWREINQQNGSYTGLPLSYGSGKAKNNPQCSLVDGWWPLAFATRCLVPSPAPEVGGASAAQGTATPCPVSWGLQENIVHGRVTPSQCDTTSFSSSLAKHYESCCTLK